MTCILHIGRAQDPTPPVLHSRDERWRFYGNCDVKRSKILNTNGEAGIGSFKRGNYVLLNTPSA